MNARSPTQRLGMGEATVFVSYRRCARDAAVLDRLQDFLTPLEREGLICGWTDRDIDGGQRWREEIEAALQRARIGVLLISQDFLTSDFICRDEVPRLLARAAEGVTTIVPLFVSPADEEHEFHFEDNQGVSRRIRLSELFELQGIARPDHTLVEMESSERDREFLALVKRVRELAGSLPDEVSAATAAEGPPTLTLQVDSIGDDLSISALRPTATSAQRTPLAELQRALARDEHDVLFRALFLSQHQLSDLVTAACGAPQAGDPADQPLRLRLLCADAEAAALPWHCLTYGGKRLGDSGWIVEILGEPDGDILTVALDNPLVVAPSDPTLPFNARSHATQVGAYVRRLLAVRRATVPWAKTYRELDVALDEEPDLIYLFAQVDVDGGLILGKDAEHLEPYPLDRLVERIARFRSKPLLWLHLVAADGRTPMLAELWCGLRLSTRLLLIQLTMRGRADASLESTLEWMDAMADGGQEPAAVASRLGTSRGPHLWLGSRSVRLSPCSDDDTALIDYIRASLIRLLLGRRTEKRQLRSGIDEVPAGYLTLYGVCGDEQACVHDLPEQARHYIEGLDRHTMVETRPLPLTMRADTGLRDEVALQLKKDLNVTSLMPAKEALKQIPVVEPDREDTLIIALAWLLEPAVDFTPAQLPDWLAGWKQGVLDVLERKQIPADFRSLVSACIQWPDGWPEGDGSDALALQREIDRVLKQGSPRGYVHRIEMKSPLSHLSDDDLDDLFREPRLRDRLQVQDLPIEKLVDYILGKTGGRFQDTVDLIYTECKHRYADFLDSLKVQDA